jgi:hypothetical protein
MKYTAQVASPFVDGEVKMTLAESSLSVIGLFDAIEIIYADMNELTLADYVIKIRTDIGDLVLSKMGNMCQPFYDELCGAYNKAVLRALFVKGSPIITARGNYRYKEEDAEAKGTAPVHVYEDSVVVLPPDIGARRIPICFAAGMEKGNHELRLETDIGETYTLARLGYDTDPFANAVEKQIRALREKSIAAAKEIDPSLTAVQASQIARLMPQGVAASIGHIAATAPSFAEALEKKIAGSRAAETYIILKGMCDPARIYVGLKKNEPRETELAESEEDGEGPTPDPYMLWLIAPSPDGQLAAVEFAEADTATFIYRTGGDYDRFAKQLNRALEAIAFKREAIRLSDKDLLKPENADYRMAAKRTAALRFVRSNFAGRIIHSSAEAWKRKLTETWGTQPPV